MDISNINWLGAIVAAIAAFVVGAVYYGALGKPWMKAARIDPAETKMSAGLFAVGFISELVMAVVLSIVIGALGMGATSIGGAMLICAILWLGLVATTLTVNQRYQGFGWDLTLIDGIHWLLVLLVQGAIIGYFTAPPAA